MGVSQMPVNIMNAMRSEATDLTPQGFLRWRVHLTCFSWHIQEHHGNLCENGA